MLELRSQGLFYSEIAKRLGLTTRQVAHVMVRHRKRYLDGWSLFSPEHAVQNESPLHKLLARAFTSEEIDRLKRDLGQVKDLARSVYGLAAEVLELHDRGFGPVAIARQLQVSRKSVARVIGRGQVPPG
jgi:hypothetical protein